MTTQTLLENAEAQVECGLALKPVLDDHAHLASHRIERGSKLHVIPPCATLEDLLVREKQHMAAAFRIFAKLGYADGASGHISLRDPTDPSTFWINPYAVHFDSIRVSDLIHVDEHGNNLSETPYKVNRAGFVIHSKIHKARPDINAACHCHAPFGKAWSTFGQAIEMLNQDTCMFYDDLAVYDGFGGPVFDMSEGDNLAAALGPTKKNIILQDHGILTAGGTIGEAVAFFIALERACETQLLVDAVAARGRRKKIVSTEAAEYTKRTIGSPEAMYMQFVPEYDWMVRQHGHDFLQ